jgi:hypothetical protein
MRTSSGRIAGLRLGLSRKTIPKRKGVNTLLGGFNYEEIKRKMDMSNIQAL